MTDRELLEFAARAAGYGYLTVWREKITDYDSAHYGESALCVAGPGGECGSFNPLTDDGDALRLAVDLGIQIIPGENYVECVKVMRSLKDCRFLEMHKDDKRAATRRAVARAAAEIGKTLGE